MGTSAMLYVYKDKECRIAALTGMDGYPEGEGLKILGFVSNGKNAEKLEKSLDRYRPISKEEVEELRERYGQWDWEDEYYETHPGYSLWGGAELLDRITSGD